MLIKAGEILSSLMAFLGFNYCTSSLLASENKDKLFLVLLTVYRLGRGTLRFILPKTILLLQLSELKHHLIPYSVMRLVFTVKLKSINEELLLVTRAGKFVSWNNQM